MRTCMATIMILLRRTIRCGRGCVVLLRVFCLLEFESEKEKRAGLAVSIECTFCCCVDIRD